MSTSAFGVEHAIAKDWRRPIAGPMARVADSNTSRFEHRADRAEGKADKAASRGRKYRQLANMSRSEARQIRQIRAGGKPVSKSAFGVEIGKAADPTKAVKALTAGRKAAVTLRPVADGVPAWARPSAANMSNARPPWPRTRATRI